MERTLSRRLVFSSLVVAAGAGAFPACTVADPQLPEVDPVHVTSEAPPPVSGGTLLVTKAGLAVAADSDRDRLTIVDLAKEAVVATIPLKKGDEPGRLVEDAAGRVHVALRGAGQVAIVDVASAKVTERQKVCSAPRGLAYDPSGDRVHVACAGGELVSFAAKGGAAVRSLRLDRDLRDVVVKGDNLLVTRFRSAEVLNIDSAGKVLNRNQPPAFFPGIFNGGPTPDDGTETGAPSDPATPATGGFTPTVAWRAVPLSNGHVVVVHQRSATQPIDTTQPDGYSSGGDGCGDGIVGTTVTEVGDDGAPVSTTAAGALTGASVPVDMAVSQDGSDRLAVVSVGSDAIFFTTSATLAQQGGGCGGGNEEVTIAAGPVAIAALSDNHWVVQTRQPATIAILDQTGSPIKTIQLGGRDVEDSGHYLFHHNASQSSALACASCHPEGHDDGHVWTFDTSGARRTQTVSGGVLATAPLHWDGDQKDMNAIMANVFVHRMGGTAQGPRHIDAFASWIDTIPAHPASPTGTAAQIAHGKQLFNDSTVACSSCHSGSHFTNNLNADVGTGHAFQVPTLIGVAARAPFLHDGCAATLKDRFDPKQAACNGGDKHGQTSQLSDSDVDDLVAYLETL